MGMWREIARASRTTTIDWLWQQTCIAHGSGGRKFKIRDAQQGQVLVRCLPGLQTCVFLLRGHMLGRERVKKSERGRKSFPISSS